MNDDQRVKDGFVNGAEFLRENNPRATCANCARHVLFGNECDYCADWDRSDPTDRHPFIDVLDYYVVNGKLVRRQLRNVNDTRLTDAEQDALDTQIDGEIEDALIAKHERELSNEPPNDGSPR